MKRSGLVILSVILIAVMLLALLQWELLPSSIFSFFTGGPNGKEMPPPGLEEKDQAGDDHAEKDSAELPAASIKSLARQIVAGAPDDYGKICAIYDWVTANIAYDVEKAKKMDDYGYGAHYLLKTRKGVCHDYAELTRALLKAVGIKATYERGEVRPAPGKTEKHAWNHAFAGETWYGLDTTWGSGFVDEGKGVFIQRPSRLYLTSTEELARLHSDPTYKESCEIEWRRARAAAEKPVYLSKYEDRLLELFNETRREAGLAPFKEESRLYSLVRQSAAEAAAKTCLDEEYSLERLNEELRQSAPQLRLAGAGLYVFTLWDYPLPGAEEIHRLIMKRKDTFLKDGEMKGLAVGAVRRGELVVVVLVGLAYY